MQQSKHKLKGTINVADGAMNNMLDASHGMAASSWENWTIF